MAEKIFTIPIQEAFQAEEGCPFCRLREALERQTLDFCLGAAMMEPEVRIEMNKSGFCQTHFHNLRNMKNKLSLGLILESHLAEVAEALSLPPEGGKKGLFSRKAESADGAEALARFAKDCYICRRIQTTEARYCSNTAWLWESEPSFREKLKRQPYFCVSHAALLLRVAKTELRASDYEALYAALFALEEAYLAALGRDVTAFTVSFDHRSADKPLTEAQKLAVERAVSFLR